MKFFICVNACLVGSAFSNQFSLRGLSLEVEAKPFYHLETKVSNNCYETHYIDEHYKENGFVIGSCDESYNSFISKDLEKICDGHSEINLKNCPTDVVEIEILKLGKKAQDNDALEVEANHHHPFYHLETKLSNNCYETRYIDEHYYDEGFVIGACDESYNSFISKDLEKICDGHSEINLKNCPTDVREIEILKLGKKAQDNDALEVEANHHHPFYHLETKLSNNCYETRYIDEHYKENGFVIGSCDDKFDTVVSKDDEKICDGHSEVNLKDCVTGIVEIEILKLGQATSI